MLYDHFMNLSMPSNILFPVLGFVTALIISAYAIPAIIKVANIRKLYDKPGGRKTHKGYVPNLGGIAIFAGFAISFVCWTNFSESLYLQYLILGLIILHFLGVKDDIVALDPYKKLVGQILAAVVLVIPGKFRINDLHGIIGLHQLSVPVSIGLSIFAVIVLINSFNLIDGIDGLAGGISLMISMLFSYIFWKHGLFNILIASMALSGALVSFLFYNRQPARIFMGDAGSMCIGYLMAAFSFQFMYTNAGAPNALFHQHGAALIAFFIIPLFDTLRVFTIRILNKKSPFVADSNHIHHKLLELGLSHGKASLILCSVNALFIGIAYLLNDLSPNVFLVIILALAASLTAMPILLVQVKRKQLNRLAPLQQPVFQVIRPAKLVKTIPSIPREEIFTEETTLSEVHSN